VPSLSIIYRAHFAYVWAVLRRLGVPEADLEDLVQEVFVVAHRRLHTFEQRSSIRTWLYAIAVRLYLNDARRRRRRGHRADVSSSDLLVVDEAADPEVHTARAQARRMLGELLENLDPDKRVVFVLAELEGLPASDIARVTGANTRTVYSRLRAARDRFNADLARVQARERNDLTIRALLRHGRAPHRPPAGAQRRVHAAIVLRLGTAATAGGLSAGMKAVALSVGLGLAPVAAIVAIRSMGSDPSEPARPAVEQPAVAAEVEPALPPRDGSPDLDARRVDDPRQEPASTVAHVRDDKPKSERPRQEPVAEPIDALQQELDLMARARAALREGDPDRALSVLDEHAKRFPGGALKQERERSRLTALCAAHRTAEASELAARLGQPPCETTSE
jgi:RNA polymerase sigma-70 factor, ECF subfamily